jgi:excinuclease ABC subunit C
MRGWWATPRLSCPAAARQVKARSGKGHAGRPPRISISNVPLSIATGCPHSAMIQSHQGINPRNVEEADVFAIHPRAGMACIQVFFFRTGQNWGNRAYFPKADPSLTPGEMLGAFIGQFYDDKPTPRMILISDDFEDRPLLAERFRCGWSARSRFRNRSGAKSASWSIRCSPMRARPMAGIWPKPQARHGCWKDWLKPSACRPPRRIEVYDNSHIMGTNAVGGMIVAGPEGFVKNQYRKFNIKDRPTSPRAMISA